MYNPRMTYMYTWRVKGEEFIVLIGRNDQLKVYIPHKDELVHLDEYMKSRPNARNGKDD
ncbi:hypothetical protein SAMN05444392_11066 [Seinonella peptonophila]|uniref:Uncharacterized protein n=1 Tax=Seinonella peptonophila TaxID=112248 RepID=A0A1M4ZR16_9BACL|nr:hypothetical protein [Seinonella peptonophila]SHF20448.1 hypothetical protein SAMN05444392_11066 [Seinonella peptonophila]